MLRARAGLGVAAALAACSSIKVSAEYDKSANYKGYKTYAWLPREPGPEEAPAARDPRIREAVIGSVNQGLAAKGLTLVDASQSPDLLVAVHGFATNRIEIQSYGYNYGPYPYGYYGTMSTTSTDVRQYRDGTLILDLIDANKKQLVWRGTATDSFSPGAEAKAIPPAVAKVLGEYPPEAQ